MRRKLHLLNFRGPNLQINPYFKMPGVVAASNADLKITKHCQENDVQDSLQQVWRIPKKSKYEPNKLMRPYDVIFCNDDVMVAEGFWPFSRIQTFTSNAKRKEIIAQGQILPFGMTLTPEHHLVVTDHHDRTVKVILQDHQTVLSWKPKMFNWPNGIMRDQSGNYLITDWADGIVYINDGEGLVLHAFPSCDGTVDRSCPEYITQDSHGRLMLTDTYDHSVKVFDSAGQMLFKFGEKNDPGKIIDPRGIAVDAQDNIIVADWGGNSVKMYSKDGAYIEDILLPHQIQHPWGLAVDVKYGKIAISEQNLKSSPALKLFLPAELM